MGEGIGFTKEECEHMFCGIKLDDHIMQIHEEAAAGVVETGVDDGDAAAGMSATGGDGGDGLTATVGDCIEVWWDEEETFYPCVVLEEREDTGGITASLCSYDDYGEWHDLSTEKWRHIPATKDRLRRVTVKNLRLRLQAIPVPFNANTNKAALVGLLHTHLTGVGNVVGAETGDTTSALPRHNPKPGDSLEIWWQDTNAYHACVVAEQVPDVGGTTASLCVYDDDDTGKDYFHNLEDVLYRRLSPALERIKKLKIDVLRSRLLVEGLSCRDTDGLSVLAQKLFDRLTPGPVVGAGAVRAKYGHSHKERVYNNKRKSEDMATAAAERLLRKKKPTTVSGSVDTTARQQTTNTHRTATQVVHDIGVHALALHTLATKGDRRDDRQTEREGYNLLTLCQSMMGDGCHIWKTGDDDMSLLPEHIRMIYDTDGWVCINTYADDDHVVFKRPPVPVPVRGSGSQRRPPKFEWTVDMGRWLHTKTTTLAFKSVPFADLAREAEAKWGHKAPKQEQLENKIKSRDLALKRGGPAVKWIRDTMDDSS